jgi:hypothetical protein
MGYAQVYISELRDGSAMFDFPSLTKTLFKKAWSGHFRGKVFVMPAMLVGFFSCVLSLNHAFFLAVVST